MQAVPKSGVASKRRYLVGIIVLTALAFFAAAANRADAQNDATPIDPKIINGSNAVIGSYPFMVQLETADGEHVCGGTLYTTRTVLTATHCLINPRTGQEYRGVKDYVIRYGTSTQDGGHTVGFTNYYPSGADNSHRKNDVTVVALDAPVELGDRVGLLSLATNTEIASAETVTAVGWGKDSNNGGPAERLQQAQIKLNTTEECVAAYGEDRFFPDRQFCGGGVTTDICHGDSGGPIMIGVDGQWKQVGMNAEIFEYECLSGKPSKFSNMAYYRDFVQNVNPVFPTPTVEPTPTPEPAPRKCQGEDATVDLARGDKPTEGDDRIIGTNGADVIEALGGNDIICALGGDDKILGGDGDDQVLAGPGDDIIYGGPGNDKLYGHDGFDRVQGGDGNDTLQGNKGPDVLIGAGGDDLLMGNRGDDYLAGGDGDDRLNGHRGSDVLRGGDGTDRIFGGLGTDTLTGGPGEGDICRGARGDDVAGPSCEETFSAEPLAGLDERLEAIDVETLDLETIEPETLGLSR